MELLGDMGPKTTDLVGYSSSDESSTYCQAVLGHRMVEVPEVQVAVVAQEVLAEEVQLIAHEVGQEVEEDILYSLEEHMVEIHDYYPEYWYKGLLMGE